MNTISFAVFCDRLPFVRVALWRTVAKTLSMGLDVRGYSCVAIVEERKQRVIPRSFERRAVRLGEDCRHLRRIEVNGSDASALNICPIRQKARYPSRLIGAPQRCSSHRRAIRLASSTRGDEFSSTAQSA